MLSYAFVNFMLLLSYRNNWNGLIIRMKKQYNNDNTFMSEIVIHFVNSKQIMDNGCM